MNTSPEFLKVKRYKYFYTKKFESSKQLCRFKDEGGQGKGGSYVLAGVKMERMKVARVRVLAVCWQG
jgi:hypothetical protein